MTDEIITPRPLYKLYAPRFTPEQLEELCESLNVDYYDIKRSTRALTALTLQKYMAARSRLHELLAKLYRELPQISFSSYLFLVVAEQFPTEKKMIALLQRFGIEPRDFGGREKFAWGSQPWLEQKARALQVFLEERGRIQELLAAVAQADESIDLSFYQDLEEAEPAVEPRRAAEEEDTPDAYDDFDIQFLYRRDGRLTVKVLNSPRGQKSAPDDHRVELEDVDLQDRLTYLQGLVARAEDAVEIGERLTQALLPDGIMSHLRESITEAGKAGYGGLRIRIWLEPGQAKLGSYPWEYCRDERGYLSTRMPVVRYLETNQPDYEPITVPGKVRLLVVVASPTDYDELDVDAEEAWIRAAVSELEQEGRLELKVLRHATRLKLMHDVHRDFKPHILHFIGHGDLQESGEGALILEEDSQQRKGDAVSATDMLALLESSDVRLVLLNACLTAAYEASTAIMGVAPRLVWGGMPAVIAMQFSMPDKVATTFSRELYGFLAKARPLDEAMTKARLSAYFTRKDKVFWGIPVLFMRTPDGRLWTDG